MKPVLLDQFTDAGCEFANVRVVFMAPRIIVVEQSRPAAMGEPGWKEVHRFDLELLRKSTDPKDLATRAALYALIRISEAAAQLERSMTWSHP